MRKKLRALLACLLAIYLIAVAAVCETADGADIPESLVEADIIGVWRLSLLRIDGTAINPEMMGIDMRYDFREDHTAHGSFYGAMGDSGQAEETWSLDADQAMIYVSGSPFLKVRCEDGTIFLLMDEEITGEADGDLVFTRPEEEQSD